MERPNAEMALPASIGGSDYSELLYTPEYLSSSSGCLRVTEGVELPGRNLWKPAKQYVLGASKEGWKTSIPDDHDYVDRVFANEAKRLEAINSYRTHDSRFQSNILPLMFQFGIRYAPDPYPAPVPVSRSIMITGFPKSTPLSDIMARIRGGQVISITTATSPDPVGRTIIIEFKDSVAAWKYVHYVEREMPFIFSASSKVTLLRSHSYPMRLDIQRDVSSGITRLAVFLNFAESRSFEFLDDLKSMLGSPEDILEDSWIEKGALFILFKSVATAKSVYQPHVPISEDEECEDKGGENEVSSQAEKKQETIQRIVNLLDSPIHEISHEKFPVLTESPTRAPQEKYPLIDISIDEDGDEKMISKHTLPQNDPAYYELLHRDSSDLVRLSEANAIFHAQPFRTIPKAEMRARYSGIFGS
ncbi:hypothetical protein GL218_09062 [Daldinia childiae]|uniref:uncharacterized protein n=1 Tax=Daldinia childiae TaxID=326645 RepID=UPI0014461505|nr:uncharacterized protein GL218_09062 [Daldinia childiae]KAF3066604.1 hypothetical protein GL218_09062 [Daldinia childiae]